jgi:hypothetical protein
MFIRKQNIDQFLAQVDLQRYDESKVFKLAAHSYEDPMVSTVGNDPHTK